MLMRYPDDPAYLLGVNIVRLHDEEFWVVNTLNVLMFLLVNMQVMRLKGLLLIGRIYRLPRRMRH